MFRKIMNYKRLKDGKLVKPAADGDSPREKESLENFDKSGTPNVTDVSGSAIQLILDNIASPEDVKNIYTTDADLRSNYCTKLKKCEFCKKNCNKCRVCCPKKEMQMYLVNHAMKKLSFMSVYGEELLSARRIVREMPSPLDKLPEEKPSIAEGSFDSFDTKNELRKIRRKLKNIKKYYPHIYHHQGNVIEKWGGDADISSMKREIIELDTKITQLFWI